MSTFGRFPPRLQQAIVSRLGWTSLRPVQDLAGAAILEGLNAVVLAPTAGGKTEASMFPVISRLIEEPPSAVGALYIAPIKALLNNQEERLGTYAEMVGMSRFVWHGDTGASAKKAFLKAPCEILMTTPESLEVMLLSSRVDAQAVFRDLRAVVIDEVHAFAGTDRGAHLASVLERLIHSAGAGDVQRIGLSATVGNPAEILHWLQGSSSRQGTVIDPPKQPSRREILVRYAADPMQIGRLAAEIGRGNKSLLFCQSRALSEEIADGMRGRGVDVYVHHSSVALEERQAAEETFNSGGNACIVCTSTLELGIDVGDLDLVLQVDAPSTVSSFLQRMGRTGRRVDTVANTTFLCQDGEAVLQAVAIAELAREGWVESVRRNSRSWPVLAHQLMAMTLQFSGVSAERAWDRLSTVPDFGSITADEFDHLVRHMVAGGWLFSAGGVLSLGETAERRFGRKNFMDLYAVFSSPANYRVVGPGGTELGALEQDFVDRLVEGMTAFLLGGRAWTVETIDHSLRLVIARPAPKGTKPRWGSHLPQFLGREVCQKMRKLILGTDVPPYLDPAAARMLDDWRKDLGDTLRRSQVPIRMDENGLVLWTFAGGRINKTLELALEELLGQPLTSDNFAMRAKPDVLSSDTVRQALEELSRVLWEGQFLTRLSARLPAYRLSKFQDALPTEFVAEMLSGSLLDVFGAQEILANCATAARGR